MRIAIEKLQEVAFIDPLLWVNDNNYLESAFLTGDRAQSEFSLYGWNRVEQDKFSHDSQVWDKLNHILKKYDFSQLPYPANRCGWIGYLNYDLGSYLEELPDKNSYSYQIPQASISLYKNYRYWDNKNKQCWEIIFEFFEYTPSCLNQNEKNYHINNFS